MSTGIPGKHAVTSLCQHGIDPFGTIIAISMSQHDHGAIFRRSVPRRQAYSILSDQVNTIKSNILFHECISRRDDARWMQYMIYTDITKRDDQNGQSKNCACDKGGNYSRSEEHTSELQSLTNLVCRLLLEKKKKKKHLAHICDGYDSTLIIFIFLEP